MWKLERVDRNFSHFLAFASNECEDKCLVDHHQYCESVKIAHTIWSISIRFFWILKLFFSSIKIQKTKADRKNNHSKVQRKNKNIPWVNCCEKNRKEKWIKKIRKENRIAHHFLYKKFHFFESTKLKLGENLIFHLFTFSLHKKEEIHKQRNSQY